MKPLIPKRNCEEPEGIFLYGNTERSFGKQIIDPHESNTRNPPLHSLVSNASMERERNQGDVTRFL